MAVRCVYDKVSEAVRFLSDPLFADVSKAERLLYAGMMFTGALAHTLNGLSREEIATHADQIKADINRTYADFIAPTDLPGVPNVVEPFIDQMVGAMLGAVMDKGLDRLKVIHDRMEELLRMDTAPA